MEIDSESYDGKEQGGVPVVGYTLQEALEPHYIHQVGGKDYRQY